MLAQLLTRFHRHLVSNRTPFFLSLLLLIGILFWGISRLQISESIFSTLPKGENFDEFNQLISNKNLSNQVIFAISVPTDENTEVIKDSVVQFSEQLLAATSNDYLSISPLQEDVQELVYEHSLHSFPFLIDSTYYSYIRSRIAPDSILKSVQSVRSRLATPEGIVLKQFLLNDPLGITFPYFDQLRAQNNTDTYELEDGLLFSQDRKSVLLMGGTSFDTGNSGASSQLYEQLEEFKQRWNNEHPNYTFKYFGTFAIAAENAIQVKKDSVLTLSIALVLIIGLLWYYYKKPILSVYILLPAAFGGLFALGMIGFIKPNVSGIAMATGAVLLGIALDYSIHFITHLRHVKSIDRTLEDITTPLLTGSATTILAYSALNFASSEILQDFGLFAGLALSGALLFTLTALPAIIQISKVNYINLPELKPLFKIPQLPIHWRKPFLAIIAVITAFLYYFSTGINFDGELQNLSFSDPKITQLENELTQIDPKKEGKIFLFATDTDSEKAAAVNYHLYQKLQEMQQQKEIKFFTTVAPFYLADSVKNVHVKQWNTFWENDNLHEKTIAILRQNAAQVGFTENAFQPFENLLHETPESNIAPEVLLNSLNLTGFVDTLGGKTTFVSTVVAEKANLTAIKDELQTVEGATIFHRAAMAESLLKIVRSDFNYILLISASIVFLALLLLYGRIELALLSFLPMAISWIWILGLTSLLDIQFNFVNVVFATFIFGLGDDFSIFMTDGILDRYKYGKNNMQSYQSAISLSGITVLIGTGVLLLASHPALRSIAVVSVPGILCIVFISLYVQPVLFDLFVQDRVDQGRTPLTLYTYIKTWLDFLFFAFISYLSFFIMVLIHICPISKEKKKEAMAWTLHKLSTAGLFFGNQLRKKAFGVDKRLLDKPGIVIANHASFLDTMIVLWQYPKAVLMVKEWVYKSPLYGWVIRYANYIYMEEGPDANLEQAQELVKKGYTIIVFPEGTRSPDGKIHRFHKGAFLLAEQLQLPIQPMLIHGAGYCSPKGELTIKPGPVNVNILPAISYEDRSWGTNYQERAKSISKFFKKQHAEFEHQMNDLPFMKERIFHNYIYKGPILEWYYKIKWELEKKNYEYYDQLIENRKTILDLGCGYGFLSFYLHYRNEQTRQITAIDYDESKIAIAANSYGKTDRLQFVKADISTFDITPTDVIFLNDVLHYLSKEKQLNLLKRCIENLHPNGILFIRDGIVDDSKKHKTTQLTEKLSTKIFRFNKKSEEFHFFSVEDMQQLADSYHLGFDMQKHSDKTSNVLFILTKHAH